MALKGIAKREYQKLYMRRYRRWVRGGGVGNVMKRDQEMWRQRHVMKIALNRLERARAREEANPGTIDERELSLGWQYLQLERESKGHVKA